MPTILTLLILLPLAGAFFQVLFGRLVPRRAVESVACGSIIASFVTALAAYATGYQPLSYSLYQWISVDNLSAAADIHYDSLSALLSLMVTFVSGLIMVYSASFMRSDRDYVRFFCYLCLFVFFMLVIVLADNLIFLFLGWEGVGFCSYALIGFWYENETNASAGRKAFLLTRIGDIGFGIAVALLFARFNTLTISAINADAHTLTAGAALLIGLLFCWAAVGKSAQLPLLVWLPDAMAGPTPVSALIHAATMVTAGVYLLVRMFPLISLVPEVLQIIALIGSVTALYAACAALVQLDIKRILAYSTISQVGYMFLGIGAGDVIGSIFHLLTHAFFKSLLFLAAGCIIYSLHDEHNILRMGAKVRRKLPAVFLLILAGGLALGGVPPSSGYVSKGRILLATVNHQNIYYGIIWVCGTLAAFLTSLYTFRLLFLVFTGNSSEGQKSRMRDVPLLMTIILWPLAILALTAGIADLPQIWKHGGWLASMLAGLPGAVPELGATGTLEWLVEIGDGLLAIAGIALAYFLYGPPDILHWRSEKPFGPVLTDILKSGFGLDRLYAFVVVRPYTQIAYFFWQTVDKAVLDRTIIRAAGIFPLIAAGIRTWNTGMLSTSLKMLLLGFSVILVFLAF